MLKIKIKNTYNIEKDIIKSLKKQEHVNRQILHRVGVMVAGKGGTGIIQREMTKKPKSGREYIVYVGIGGRQLKKPRKHIASTPREFPAVITGELRKSTGATVVGAKILEVGSNANHSTRMNKRNDYLKRGVHIVIPKMRKMVRMLWSRNFK